MQRAEINLDQHRDNHHPNQQTHGQIDLGHLHRAQSLKHRGHDLPQNHADDDAQRDPQTEVTLKHTHGLG